MFNVDVIIITAHNDISKHPHSQGILSVKKNPGIGKREGVINWLPV